MPYLVLAKETQSILASNIVTYESAQLTAEDAAARAPLATYEIYSMVAITNTRVPKPTTARMEVVK
jgi:hypothetical protein